MHLSSIEVICTIGAMLAGAVVGLVSFDSEHPPRAVAASTAETIELAPGNLDFPLPGNYVTPDGTALVEHRSFAEPIHIMKHQVSVEDYRNCVSAGGCQPVNSRSGNDAAKTPLTGVSYLDAQEYAAWYSKMTGMSWRLPTAAEWAFAAKERFAGDKFSGRDNADNPAIAWIRKYKQEASANRTADPLVKPRGHYGANSNGVVDLAGNVWEWTSTCYRRITLANNSSTIAHITDNCGVRVVEGRHRTYMTDFMREGKSGACAVGTPPDHLGFRLVREEVALPPVAYLRAKVRSAIAELRILAESIKKL